MGYVVSQGAMNVLDVIPAVHAEDLETALSKGGLDPVPKMAVPETVEIEIEDRQSLRARRESEASALRRRLLQRE
jgi:hypothetical protein